MSVTTKTYDIAYQLLYTDRALYDAALAYRSTLAVQTQIPPATAYTAFTGFTSITFSLGNYATTTIPPWSLGLGPSSSLGDPLNYLEFQDAAATALGLSYTPHQLPTTQETINVVESGTHLVFNTTLIARWVLFIVFQGVSAQPATPTPTNSRYLGARRFMSGFELASNGEGITAGAGSQWASRDASRTPDGFGYAYRATTVNTTLQIPTAATNKFVSWERFYIRLRTLPVGGSDTFWEVLGSVQAGSAVLMAVTTTGTLQAYNMGNAAFPGTLMGTSAALTVGTWYRLDMRLKWKCGVAGPAPYTSTAGSFSLYINGTLSFTGVGSGGQGLDNTDGIHVNSSVGKETSQPASFGAELDIDDWVNAQEYVVGTTLYPGHDLASGSHIHVIHPTGFGAAQGAGWTGDWRELDQLPNAGSNITAGLSGTTTSNKIDLTSDYEDRFAGCAAFVVGAFFNSSPGGTVQIGWASAGPASNSLLAVTCTSPVWVSTGKGTTAAIYTVASGSTSTALADLGPLRLQIVSSATGGGTTVNTLMGAAEYIGVFGPEDNDPTTAPLVLPPQIGIHNAPYTNPSSNLVIAPYGVVSIFYGIYTGNNLGQDVLETIPAHWWWVRPLSGGATTGAVWYSSMAGAHGYLQQTIATERMPRAFLDSSGTPTLRTTGTSVTANATAVTYQWVAVSDVAFRYMLNGAFAHLGTLGSAVNTLIDPDFTPDAAFLFVESLGIVGTTSQYYKGPGSATNGASPLDATETASVAIFAEGSITSKTAIHNTNAPQTAYSAWRLDDGSGSARWFAAGSYTGDGTTPRVISCPLNGQKPGWVLVSSNAGTSYIRDVSHTSTNSCTIALVNSTTAITSVAVADQFTIGITVNTNAVVYKFFVLPAINVTAGVGGGIVTEPMVRPTLGPFPPSPPTTTTFALRRLRRFSLPFDQNLRLFLNRIEFLVQAGVGLASGQGMDAEIMVRFSRDGGVTYGTIYRVSAGRIGDYDHRTFLNRLGHGRNWVCELTTTDPVFFALIDCFADMERGSN